MENPLSIVIFGATGDLFKKKLAPALYNLYKENKLPCDTAIFGFSRRALSSEEWRVNAKIGIEEVLSDSNNLDIESFLSKFHYHASDVGDKETYNHIKNILGKRDEDLRVCCNKLFYLSVAPSHYETIFRELSSAGFSIPCAPIFGKENIAWSRLLIEKPFGLNSGHAESLENILSKKWGEDQIYRIDHYFFKQMLSNLISFRFYNSIFKSLWSRNHIEKIEIRIIEENLLGKRARFYDNVGALLDVGQNHLLAILALTLMEKPSDIDDECMPDCRAKVLEETFIDEGEEIIRGQYEGYLSHEGVRESSNTETYFKAKLKVQNERWKGVPIIIEHGKGLNESKAEIKITFKNPSEESVSHAPNVLLFNIQPAEDVKLDLWTTNSENATGFIKKTLEVNLESNKNPSVFPYEKLLSSAISGDKTNFVSASELKEEWRITEDIMKKMESAPLKKYKIGSIAEEIN